MAPWTGPPAPGHTPESPAPLKIPDGGRLEATPLGSGPGSGAFGSSFHGWSSDSVLYVLQWNCDDFVAADGTKVKPLTSHTGTKERKDGRDWMAIKPTKLFPKAILSDEALLLGLILVGVESLDSRIPVPLRPSLGLTHMQALRLSAKRDSSPCLTKARWCSVDPIRRQTDRQTYARRGGGETANRVPRRPDQGAARRWTQGWNPVCRTSDMPPQPPGPALMICAVHRLSTLACCCVPVGRSARSGALTRRVGAPAARRPRLGRVPAGQPRQPPA